MSDARPTTECQVVSAGIYLPLLAVSVGMALVGYYYPVYVAAVFPVIISALAAGLSYSDRYEVVDCG